MQEIKIYKSGLRLIVETSTSNDSVSFNMYVKTGSVNEDDTNRGISHFIEHMLFKSTENRSTLELNKAFDKIGASANAFTSSEETNYYVKCLKENLPTCVELFSDMLFAPKFDEEELEKERLVILEEIATYKDDNSIIARELLRENVLKETIYAHPVIGYEQIVKKLTRDDLVNYYKKHYTPNNIILSFAGNITMEDAKNLTQTYFQSKFKGISLPNYEEKDLNCKLSPKSKFCTSYKTETEQSLVYISFPACNIYNKDVIATELLMSALGDGMSSPLFTKVREERGLVYYIDSSAIFYKVGGLSTVVFSSAPKNIEESIIVIRDLLEDVKENGIKEDLLQIAKTSIITDYIFSCETNEEIAANNANYLAQYDKLENRKEEIAKINAVTLQEVNDIAKQIFTKNNVTISYVGKNIHKNLLNLFLAEPVKEKEENIIEEELAL